MKIQTLLIFLTLLLASCQTQPTRVIETSNHEIQALVEKASKKIEITPETQIIDVRSSFEYSMVHLPGSINLDWEHFALNQPPAPGRLQDPSAISRRLVLKGLHPDHPVVIVGDGTKGHGEEGRVAWMLFYLGFEDVQTADINLFKESLSNIQSQPRQNAERWSPDLREGINLTRKQFIESIKSRTEGKKVHVIDVRSKEEYFSKKGLGETYNTPDLQALNINWKEFFNDDGRPNLSLRARLREVGVGLNDRVIVISNNGVRSAAATWALLALGFNKATNYTGGYAELLHR